MAQQAAHTGHPPAFQTRGKRHRHIRHVGTKRLAGQKRKEIQTHATSSDLFFPIPKFPLPAGKPKPPNENNFTRGKKIRKNSSHEGQTLLFLPPGCFSLRGTIQPAATKGLPP
ncbi:hypothetical protein OH491_23980 [Termitidicoccus mucosus]|uniref:hypothetical protein n=1 Tax=Termitidicoccus mucosus TaxID=1184151 RepID=UPI0011AB7DB6